MKFLDSVIWWCVVGVSCRVHFLMTWYLFALAFRDQTPISPLQFIGKWNIFTNILQLFIRSTCNFSVQIFLQRDRMSRIDVNEREPERELCSAEQSIMPSSKQKKWKGKQMWSESFVCTHKILCNLVGCSSMRYARARRRQREKIK